MNKTALAALLAAFVATPADAADLYAGIKLGKSRYDITGVITPPTAIGVFGGYTFNPNLAVEAEYIDLGNNGTSSATAMDVSALLFYPGDAPFSLYAKLSYASSTWKAPNQVQYNSSFTYGLGCQYDASQSLSFRLSWDRYLLGNQVATNADVLSFAGMVRF